MSVRDSGIDAGDRQARDGRLVVIMRHGDANIDPNSYAKHLSMGLSYEGRRQAREAARALAPVPFNLIVASPFGRALETARIVASEQSCDLEVDDRLVERSFPDFYGKSYEEIAEEIGKDRLEILRNRSEEFDHPSGVDVVAARRHVVEAVNAVLARDAAVTLAVTHGGPHGWLLTHLLGMLDIRGARAFVLGHARLSVLEMNPRGGLARIMALNCPASEATRLILAWTRLTEGR